MNDMPVRSVKGVILNASDYVLGDHELDHHSHKASVNYTHSSIPDYQASFQWGYPMSSYEELILSRQEESVSRVIEHWFVHIGYDRDHGLSFASGGNSSVWRILMPSKSDSLEAFPKTTI